MKHEWYKCPPDCENPHCPYCRGGLGLCVVCGAAEGELTTDCPGHKVTEEIKQKVYQGKLDFFGGQWIQKTPKQTKATIRDQHGTPVAEITSKNTGKFPPVIVQFRPPTSGEAEHCDIVVLQGGKVLEHYKDVLTHCDHPEVVFSGEYFASEPPLWHWICPMCGETGASKMEGGLKGVNQTRFNQLLKLFGKD